MRSNVWEANGWLWALAPTIANFFVKKIGHKERCFRLCFHVWFSTYGGVSLFVVGFAVFPIASVLFKELGIPKRLIPAAIMLRCLSFYHDGITLAHLQFKMVFQCHFLIQTYTLSPGLGVLILYLYYSYRNVVVKQAYCQSTFFK